MADLSSFWDKMADRYVAQPIANETAYQTKLELTQSRLHPDMELLEFGCGSGATALAHAPFVRHITAIDFSARMVEIARARARDAGITNVSFEQADITTLPVADGSYDMVLGLSILHLLKHPPTVMARVFRLLKPGGYFVSSTACVGDSMGFFKYIAPLGQALGLLPQLNVMTTRELTDNLVASGFQIDHQWSPGPREAVFIIARKP